MPIMSSDDFPFTNKRYWTEFTISLTLLISRMAPWTLLSTPNLSPSSPQNCRLVVVDAKERGTSLLYKSKVVNPVDNVPVYAVCLLLHGEHYYALNSLSAWFGRSYYCMECEKAFNNKNQHKCKSEYTCSMCKEKGLPVQTILHKIM